MKHVFLSLEFSNENQQMLSLIKKEKDIELVDLKDCEYNDVIVITNGPLTELGNMLLDNWKLKNKIDKILLVGGSDKYGDVTPAAERNIYNNPYAAQQIFMSRIPIVMFGLNTTRFLENRALAPLIYLKDETIFDTEECGVYVETKGDITMGMTVTDLYSDKQFPDHDVLMVKSIDEENYNRILGQMF